LWDKFVEASPQGTIFSKSCYLDCLGERYSLYFAKKGEHLAGGVVVLEDEKGAPLKAPYPFTPYQGVLCRPLDRDVIYDKNEEEYDICEFLIDRLIESYGAVSLMHSPWLNDVRPFLWKNYHTPELGKFDVSVWYSAVVDLDFSTEEEYLMKIRKARRREYAKKDLCVIEESADVELLCRLQEKTLERQNVKMAESVKRIALSIARGAITKGFGRVTVCKIDGVIVSAYLLIFDSKRGYAVLNGNDPDYRSSGSGTIITLNNMFYVKNEKKLRQYDFLGANSPQRGDYKISYNSRLLPHFLTNYKAETLVGRT
jgi:hypothetical protein